MLLCVFLPLLYIFVCLFLAYLVVLNRVSIRWYLLILLRGLYRCFMIILNKNLWYFSVVFRLVIFVIVGSFCFVFSLKFVLVAFLQIVPFWVFTFLCVVLLSFFWVFTLLWISSRFLGDLLDVTALSLYSLFFVCSLL